LQVFSNSLTDSNRRPPLYEEGPWAKGAVLVSPSQGERGRGGRAGCCSRCSRRRRGRCGRTRLSGRLQLGLAAGGVSGWALWRWPALGRPPARGLGVDSGGVDPNRVRRWQRSGSEMTREQPRLAPRADAEGADFHGRTRSAEIDWWNVKSGGLRAVRVQVPPPASCNSGMCAAPPLTRCREAARASYRLDDVT